MNKFKAYLAAITAVTMIGTAQAEEQESTEPAKTENPIRLELSLTDGSHLSGTPAIDSVSVQTSYAKMDIPLSQILVIKIGKDHETAAIELNNGDKLKGVISIPPLKLETLFGKVSVDIEHIKELRVTLSGSALPAGEGPLSFGGLKWQPWRTMFEVQGDKLTSLPKAREGFDYGHGGGGRGPTLMSNIGNSDWKDYRIEFEYGMTGVNPAFNPSSLPLDYRSGTIMFHVTDAKENWNIKGASCYSLNFPGDGTWILACVYNHYCPAQSGYAKPKNDVERTLAQGKGLKHDIAAGNKIRIELKGTSIRIWVDGEQIADVRDEKMGEEIGGQTLDHGGIGFSWGFDSMGWIRNFSAKKL